MDGLELVVDERGLHEWGQLGVLVDEALEIGEEVTELIGRGRDERRRLDGAPALPTQFWVVRSSPG